MLAAFASLAAILAAAVPAPADSESPVPPAPLAPAPGADSLSLAEAERLVAELGDEDFQRREDATKALRARAAEALPSIAKAAASHPDPEVRHRALGILKTELEIPLELAERIAPQAEALRSADPEARKAAADRIADAGMQVYSFLVRASVSVPEARSALDRLLARSLSLAAEAEDVDRKMRFRVEAAELGGRRPPRRKNRNLLPPSSPIKRNSVTGFSTADGGEKQIFHMVFPEVAGIAAGEGVLAVAGPRSFELWETAPAIRLRWRAEKVLAENESPRGIAIVPGAAYLRSSSGRMIRFDLDTGTQTELALLVPGDGESPKEAVTAPPAKGPAAP